MSQLSAILAEQSSPAEVLVFLAVIVAIFLVSSFLIYVLIMAVLRLGLSEKVPLRRVLFPSGKRLRENLGDYVLAASTSILLALTLASKHDLVQQIRNYDMDKVKPGAVAILFDFGLPDELLQRISEQAKLTDVVQPLLEAGKVEQSDLLVRSVIPHVPKGWLTPQVLIIACIILAIFYLLWLARSRYGALKSSPDSAPKYAATFRPLLTLAVCVGLLLASAVPLAQGGEKFLARSALNAMEEGRKSDRIGSDIAGEITKELRKQRERATFLYCPGCAEPTKSIWETNATPEAVGKIVDDLAGRVDAASSACESACAQDRASLQSELAPIASRVSALEARLGAMQRALAQVSERQFPELQRGLEKDRSETTRKLDLLDRRLTLLTQEFDKLGGVSEALRNIERRVAWLESQHRLQTATTDPRTVAACREYAAKAVDQNKWNLEYRCNFSGSRWSGNFQQHYDWCLTASEAARRAETTARDNALRECHPPVR